MHTTHLLQTMERCVEFLQADMTADEEPIHSYKLRCPFTGKFMKTPVKASDEVIYELNNIRKWRGGRSPVSGQTESSSILRNCYRDNEVRDIQILLNNQPHTNRSICEFIRDLINNGFKPRPKETQLTHTAFCVKMIKTFHCLTKNKFSDDQVDMHILCNDASTPRDPDWWPIKDSEFTKKAIWNACKSLRDRVYFYFEIFQELGPTLADQYFPPQMMKPENNSRYRYILIYALTDSLNSLPADHPGRDRIKKCIERNSDDRHGLEMWRAFWGESYEPRGYER